MRENPGAGSGTRRDPCGASYVRKEGFSDCWLPFLARSGRGVTTTETRPVDPPETESHRRPSLIKTGLTVVAILVVAVGVTVDLGAHVQRSEQFLSRDHAAVGDAVGAGGRAVSDRPAGQGTGEDALPAATRAKGATQRVQHRADAHRDCDEPERTR